MIRSFFAAASDFANDPMFPRSRGLARLALWARAFAFALRPSSRRPYL